MATQPEPGAQPDAEAESPQLAPGGPDAIDDPRYGDTPGEATIPDPDPELNPATAGDRTPDQLAEADDSGEPTTDGATGSEPPA